MNTKEELNKKISQKDDEIKSLKNKMNKLKDFYENIPKKIQKQNENWKKIVLNLTKKIEKHNADSIEIDKDIKSHFDILAKKITNNKQLEISAINKEIKKELEKENLYKKQTFPYDDYNYSISLKEIFEDSSENKSLKDYLANNNNNNPDYNSTSNSNSDKKDEKNLQKNFKALLSEDEKKDNINIQNKIKSIMYPKENKNISKKLNENNNNNNNNNTQENCIDNSINYNINAINIDESSTEILKINKTKKFKDLKFSIKNQIEKLHKIIEEESESNIFMEFILPNFEDFILKKKIYSFEFNDGNFTYNQYLNEKIFVENFKKYENLKIKILKKENKRINVIANAIENFFMIYVKRRDSDGNLIIKGILNRSFEKFEKFFKGRKKTLDYCESIKVEVYMFKWELFYDYDIDEFKSNSDLKELKKLKSIGELLKDTRNLVKKRNLMIEEKNI